MLTFIVSGEPVPKARSRVVRATGRSYTPKRTVAAEQHVRDCFKRAYPDLRSSKEHFELSLSFSFKGVGRGDWDNYGKLVSDALKGYVWDNDRQIRIAHVWLYSNCTTPCTVVVIRKGEQPTRAARLRTAPRVKQEATA